MFTMEAKKSSAQLSANPDAKRELPFRGFPHMKENITGTIEIETGGPESACIDGRIIELVYNRRPKFIVVYQIYTPMDRS